MKILVLMFQLAPYIMRGDQVEAAYRAYSHRLEAFYTELKATLEVDASDLLGVLDAPPQKPSDYGYQILPRLVADTPSPVSRVPTSYSWPRTEKFISDESGKLNAAAERLATLREVQREQ